MAKQLTKQETENLKWISCELNGFVQRFAVDALNGTANERCRAARDAYLNRGTIFVRVYTFRGADFIERIVAKSPKAAKAVAAESGMVGKLSSKYDLMRVAW